jgi:hypothetical protein
MTISPRITNTNSAGVEAKGGRNRAKGGVITKQIKIAIANRIGIGTHRELKPGIIDNADPTRAKTRRYVYILRLRNSDSMISV